MNIDKVLSLLLEADENKTWLNPKTGNRVGYFRALQLGLIKPHEVAGQNPMMPVKGSVVNPAAKKGHATGPRPKKDPNAPKAWFSHLTKYKLSAYPVGIPESEVKQDFTGDIDSHAVLQWKSPKTGETVRAYTEKFMKKNADIKWKRILKVKPKDISHIQATADKILSSNADDKLKQAAAIISIISHTGLRIGSLKGLEKTGNRGVSTLAPDNFKVSGSNIKFNFVGKSYQDNEAEIFDQSLSKYLTTKQLERKGSPLMFTVSKGYIDQVYDKYMKMEKFKIKDLRTYVANKVAKDILYKDSTTPPPLPSNPKEIKTAVKNKLKGVFEKVSQILNNTPNMARTSYIHPQIIHNWLGEIGVKAEFVGYNESVQLKEDEFDDVISAASSNINNEDAFEDVDTYALPEWWDENSGWELVPIK